MLLLPPAPVLSGSNPHSLLSLLACCAPARDHFFLRLASAAKILRWHPHLTAAALPSFPASPRIITRSVSTSLYTNRAEADIRWRECCTPLTCPHVASSRKVGRPLVCLTVCPLVGTLNPTPRRTQASNPGPTCRERDFWSSSAKICGRSVQTCQTRQLRTILPQKPAEEWRVPVSPPNLRSLKPPQGQTCRASRTPQPMARCQQLYTYQAVLVATHRLPAVANRNLRRGPLPPSRRAGHLPLQLHATRTCQAQVVVATRLLVGLPRVPQMVGCPRASHRIPRSNPSPLPQDVRRLPLQVNATRTRVGLFQAQVMAAPHLVGPLRVPQMVVFSPSAGPCSTCRQ